MFLGEILGTHSWEVFMNDMFKDWTFWRPIVKIAGGWGSYFLILYLLPEKASLFLSFGMLIAFFLYLMYWLGKSTYEHKQFQIKNNYKKLTDKEYDE